MFGFAGAHRTGKTTLAKAVAERLGIRYYDASVSRIMMEKQIHSVSDLPILQRIEAQEYLLQRHLEDIAKLPRPCITDRTPLDFIGYMLGEITMHNTPPEFHQRIGLYVDTCVAAVRMHYDTVILCRPLPVYEVDPTKPPENVAYQMKVQFLIEGASCCVKPTQVGTLKTVDFNERLESSVKLVASQLNDIAADRANYSLH